MGKESISQNWTALYLAVGCCLQDVSKLAKSLTCGETESIITVHLEIPGA